MSKKFALFIGNDSYEDSSLSPAPAKAKITPAKKQSEPFTLDKAEVLQNVEKVRSVAFTPDGKRIAAGSGGGFIWSTGSTIRVWRIDDAKLLQTLAGHGYQIVSIAISQDGTHLASRAGMSAKSACGGSRMKNFCKS